jgi:AbrB family looped-hinge helix DNA binding protein
MTTTVTESNQASIPPEIVREFDIHPGTRLEWARTREGAIIVKPLPNRGEMARQLMGAGKRWLKPGVDPIGELIREREQDDHLDLADEGQ